MPRISGLIALLFLFGSRAALAQVPPDSIDADPIRCWWRTSVSAVRIGEPFSLVLTCGAVDNETATVVPDESRLDPAAVQLPPFDVLGGTKSPDLHSEQRRFFQYQYSLRLISGDFFGRDVRLPSLSISYQIQSRVDRGASIRGREHTYILPAESMRVLSLVPNDASDIRDAVSWTFADIEARRFRARVLLIAAGLLLTIGVLAALTAAVRAIRRYRRSGRAIVPPLGASAVLGAVGRELASVQRDAERDGWTEALAARLAAACRIESTVGLARHVAQIAVANGQGGQEGQLLVRGGWTDGRKLLVSGSATAESIADELARDGLNARRHEALEQLQIALTRLTAARFGRETGDALDRAMLDESLAAGVRALRRLKYEHLWIVRKVDALTRVGVELGHRVWSR